LLCAALTAGGAVGCASSPDEATFPCDHGFRAADWNSHQRLKTGQSIAKCGWLNGWSSEHIRTTLGRPDFGPRTAPEYVLPGGEDAGEDLHEWLLKVHFDTSGRVTSARTETMPI
jgi:hypothetical protein